MATAAEMAALLNRQGPAALAPNHAANMAAWLGAGRPEVPTTAPRAGLPGVTEAQAFLNQGGLAGLMGQEPVQEKMARVLQGTGSEQDLMDVYGGFVASTSGKNIGKALSMSKAARMARAKKQGFLPETYYHGRTKDFGEFKLSQSALDSGGRPIYLSDDAAVASGYADPSRLAIYDRINAQPNVLPVKAKLKNPMIVDMKGKSAFELEDIVGSSNPTMLAKARGHDGIILKNMKDIFSDAPQTQLLVFRPSQVRSIFAKFDPRKINSPDLLAGAAAVPISADAMAEFLRDR